MATARHWNEGALAAAVLLPPMAAFFSYSAARRAEMVTTLARTRAELARVAVAEERLRIARDLHDLLGHSLSLITLKAELARRVIGTDPGRAERELTELEAVARQSLTDVREAVVHYRQPDLAAELAAARQLLTAAGIACEITAPAAPDLPGDIDAVLAWTIREAATNVVRHTCSRRAVLTVSQDRGAVTAQITDSGPAPGASSAPAGPAPGAEAATALASGGIARPRRSGSGLAGLAERVRELGGELAAGFLPGGGFRLQVTIPLEVPAALTAPADRRR